MDKNIIDDAHKFCLQATINHYKLILYIGHHTSTVIC